MAKKETRVMVTMACTECKRRNYNTFKNRQKTTDRLEAEQVLPLVPLPPLPPRNQVGPRSGTRREGIVLAVSLTRSLSDNVGNPISHGAPRGRARSRLPAPLGRWLNW